MYKMKHQPTSIKWNPNLMMTAVVLLFAIVVEVGAASSAPQLFPNQHNVHVNGHYWLHPLNNTMRGFGGMNKFGKDLEAAGWQWTSTLCQLDSDGDGFSNGEELGDPSCVWQPGSVPTRATDISHPAFPNSVPKSGFTSDIMTAATYWTTCPTTVSDVQSTANEERLATRTTTALPLPDGLAHGTKFSECARILKPDPDTLPAESRSTCPHLQPLSASVRLWHDPTIWPGSVVPSSGSNMTLPANMKVIATACSFANGGYSIITIPEGSELIFADQPIHLAMKQMNVLGKLTLGSETCSLHSPITITFVAAKSEIEWYGNGILVRGNGQMHAYGTRSDVTWTRLSATAKRGSQYLLLQDAVDWAVGEQLFVTTSIWRDLENNQNEVRRITGISSDGRILVLDAPLNYSHYGGKEYQCEVGLLTRSILLRGWENGYDDRYGGHTMAVGTTAVYRLVGVKAERMGQRNVVARYPFHQHLLQDGGANSYYQQLACQDCYYRCVVIHQANHTLLRKSVAFNVTGHTYYLEEGVEMNNTIEYNLAAYVHPIGKPASGGAQGGEQFMEEPECTQPADHTASGFYIPNPHNIMVGNAASGGWAGFSFPIFDKPIRLSRSFGMVPHQYAMIRFDGNSAHSAGYHWGDAGCVYGGGKLWEDADNNNLLRYSNGRFVQHTQKNPGGRWEPAWHNITNMRTWLCQKGYSSWGDRVDLRHFEAHDCARSAVLFGTSSLTDSLIVGTSDNNPEDMELVGRQGFGFYDTWVRTILSNLTFRNFHMQRAEPSRNGRNGIIVDLTHSDIYTPWSISATKNLHYESVDQSFILRRWVRETGASRMFNIVDWDGSIVGSTGCDQYIVGSEIDWWDVGQGCFHREDWQSYICPRIPGREPVGLDMDLPGQQEVLNILTEADDKLTQANRDKLYIGHMSQWGANAHKKLIVTKNHHLATGHSGIGWYLYLNKGMPQNVSITPVNFPRGNYIMLALPYPAGTTFKIWAANRWGLIRAQNYTQLSNIDAVASSNGTFYHFDGSKLYLKVLDFWIAYPNSYDRGNASITAASLIGRVYIHADCPEKTGEFCAPTASPDPPANEMTLPITPCATEADITADPPPHAECAADTNALPASYAESNPNSTCYDYRFNWACNNWQNWDTKPGGCSAYCNTGCHQFLRPYQCSFDRECDVNNKPKIVRPWCEQQNEGHRSQDPCVITACNYTTNATIRQKLAAGTPCRLGDGRDGVCLASGACSQDAAAEDTRGIEQLATPTMSGEHIDFSGPATTSSSSVTIEFIDNEVITGTPTTVQSEEHDYWFYRHTVGADRMPFVVNVNVTIDDKERVFGDWHETASQTPQIQLACRNATHWHITAKPHNWVTAAHLENEENTTSVAAASRTTDGFWFHVTPFSSGELRLRLSFRWGGDLVRTFPCHKATSDASQQCRTPATTVRTEPYHCKYMLIEQGSNSHWYGLAAVPATGVVGLWAEAAGDLAVYTGGRFGGGAPGGITKRVLKLTLANGDVEFFEATWDVLQIKGNALKCLNGTAVIDDRLQRGPVGTCTAENVCDAWGFSAASGEPPSLCPSVPTTVAPAVTTTAPTTVAPAVTTTAPTTVAPAVTTTAPTTVAPAVTTTAPTTVAPAVTTTAPTTDAPAVTTIAPTTDAPVVRARVRLSGDGYQSLLHNRRATLFAAVLSDLRRLLDLLSHQTVEIVDLTVGSLVVDFKVYNITQPVVDGHLQSLASSSSSPTTPSSWTETESLHKEEVPSAAAVGVLEYAAAEGNDLPRSTAPPEVTPLPKSDDDGEGSCARGCQIIIIVASVVVVVALIGVAIAGSKKNSDNVGVNNAPTSTAQDHCCEDPEVPNPTLCLPQRDGAQKSPVHLVDL